MNHLLYLLDSAELNTSDRVANSILSWPITRVGEIRDQIWEILKTGGQAANTGEAQDPFDFVASASMRGEDGCIAWDCRTQKARTLARYGALYARRVLIPVRLGISPTHIDTDENTRYGLAGTLMSILEYRPLIESGIATLCAGALQYCSKHFDKLTAYPQVSSVAHSLYEREFGKFSVSYERTIENSIEVNTLYLRGPQDYIPHGKMLYALDSRPSWLPRKLQTGRQIRRSKLSSSLVKKSRAIEQVFEDMSYDVTMHQYYTRLNNATYLTDMCGEALILDSLSKGSMYSAKNALLAKNLLHSVPLLSDVPIGRVMEFRQKEPEAFLRYRAAIARIVKELAKDKPELSDKDARDIYGDVLEPELARLRTQAKSIRRVGMKKVAAKALASFVAVGLGVYGGLLPSDLAALFKVVGGVNLLSQIGETVGLIERNPQEIKNHELYFLLKLQTLAPK
jgi:hypothetical protein